LSLFFHWLTPDLATEIGGADILRQVGVDTKEVPAGILSLILYAWESLKQRLTMPRNLAPSGRKSRSSLFELIHDLPQLIPLSNRHTAAEDVNTEAILVDKTFELGIRTTNQACYQPAFESQKLLDKKIPAFSTSRERPNTSVQTNKVTPKGCFTTFHSSHTAVRGLGGGLADGAPPGFPGVWDGNESV
jgi:hypothetical protein